MNRRHFPRFAFHLLAFCVLILTLGMAASAEWKERVLYSFQGGTDGAYPAGGVVFDKQGNLYGATQQGGGTNCSPMASCGTVYQLVPPAKKGDPWTENVLHVFQGKQHNDGEFPSGGVIADALGNIYGTSSYGGIGDCVLLGIKGGCGTVFELSPPQTKGDKWTYTILYSFKGGKDGYLPFGDLVFDSAGNLYGATYFGGGKGTTCNPYYQYCGTVFKLSPPKTKGGRWTEKVLHSFAGGTDGANPNGGLILDSKGAVYGATFIGGYNCPHNSGEGCGTIFKLRPPTKEGGSWAEKQLHVFTAKSDGANPAGALIFDAMDSLYGTAEGGNINGGGIVFRLTEATGGRWEESVLHWFSNDGPGASLAGLLFDSVGSLYGTTIEGTNSCGTVFRLRPPAEKGDKWVPMVLYNLKGSPDGRYPAAGLIFDAEGNLYSTTEGGGTSGNGTIFEVSP
jgi:uncharacterized repeat protein (TIGR03803 family)